MNPKDEQQNPASAEDLAAQLAEQRAVIDVQRQDTRVRKALDAQHRIALADVDEQATVAARARKERARDAEDATALAALYRRATQSGARARIRAEIQGSAEMRALRVARVRSVTLTAGVPILGAFAAWSTTGVQAGVVRLLGFDHGSPGWWAAWAMEPALMAVVALIIIGRAVLRSSGGDTDRRATTVEWTALSTSIALNMAGGWHGHGWAAVGAALAHSVGPVGAAGVAYLIGLFDGYVSNARPWEGAPRLADLDLTGAQRDSLSPPLSPSLSPGTTQVSSPEPLPLSSSSDQEDGEAVSTPLSTWTPQVSGLVPLRLVPSRVQVDMEPVQVDTQVDNPMSTPADTPTKRLDAKAARAVIEESWAAGLTVREAASRATRASSYVGNVYSQLARERGPQPLPGQTALHLA